MPNPVHATNEKQWHFMILTACLLLRISCSISEIQAENKQKMTCSMCSLQTGEFVSTILVCPHVSALEILNKLRWVLVLELYTKSCPENLFSVRVCQIQLLYTKLISDITNILNLQVCLTEIHFCLNHIQGQIIYDSAHCVNCNAFNFASTISEHEKNKVRSQTMALLSPINEEQDVSAGILMVCLQTNGPLLH
jgi:hypothetical protein